MLAAVSTLICDLVDTARFGDMREEWNELLSASSSDCLFLTWEWLHTWWKHLAGEGRLSILTVRDDRKLIALVPLALHKPRLSFGHPLAVREFLGSGFVGSDYLDIMVRRGSEREAKEAVTARLRQSRAAFKWANVSGESCAEGIAAGLMESGWSGRRTQINVCPYIPLQGKTWDSYLAELGSEHRQNFQRKWRRLNRDFTARFDRARTPEEAREAIDLAIEQHNLRWTGRGESSAFHTPELIAFHREIAPMALEQGWLRLYVLRLNDHAAACFYGFLFRQRFYFYQSGFDPAYQKYSPGLVAMGLAIRSAIDEGAREFDLLHGNESYKAHWAGEVRRLFRIELFPPGIAGRLSQASLDIARLSKGVACRVLANPQ